MGLLKYLFTKSADPAQPLLIRETSFGTTFGYKTKSYEQVVTGPHTADFSVVYDKEKGIIKSELVIGIKMTDGSVSTYKTSVLAVRSKKQPDFYEIKELIFDNVALDTHSPGHLKLWESRMTMYERIVTGFFMGGPKVPPPFALDKNFKKDIKYFHDSFMYKLDNYLSTRAQHKFWFGG